MNSLAVVIPAYKAIYLRDALKSFAAQTDKRFNIYVGDDASPDDIRSICDDFSDQVAIHYHRFDENMGRDSLPNQWNRCIRLSNEPWIWLFSDDDIAEPKCVEAFYNHLAKNEGHYDVLHFDVAIIDSNNRIIQEPPAFGLDISSTQYIIKRLRYEISSYAVEYIFTRRIFDCTGGFVDFPAGWCSDDASWALFAVENGIHSISGSRVRWRRSTSNISNPKSPYKAQKIEAALLYLEWLISHREQMNDELGDIEALQGVMRVWFYAQLYQLNPSLGLRNITRFASKLAIITGNSLPFEAYCLIRNEFRSYISKLRLQYAVI